MLDAQNTQLPAPRVPVVSDPLYIMERSWYRFFSNLYNYFINLPYGSFYNTGTQTAAANTPTAITFDTAADARHIQIGTPTSRIVFAVDGLTTITFSIQFTNPTASEDNVYVWVRRNGVNLANTSSVVTVPKKHGSSDGAILMTVNFHEEFFPGDYLELYWITESGNSTIATVPATVSPSKPASPGVVLTLSQII